ncbi:MAG: GspE/PulE family protein [Candidatus Gracilibacteria bacterium]|nr:GspE/PulE family protein [Candidatus Gracilibacteria bacterium]
MKKYKDINLLDIQKNLGDIPKFINDAFDEAIENKASDFHIESLKDFILFRYRIDGDFFIRNKISHENYSAIITILKVMAGLKIDENKRPQDGKISYKSEKLNQDVDMRISIMPTIYGEKIVIRILSQDSSILTLEKMGFLEANNNKIKEVLKSRFGLILVAGPTGSGKSTTLFSLINEFNPLEFNISTLEDPIEYNVDFVNQTQIRPSVGFNFADGLRSLVRQDPDIIMVGEIRDTETATLAIEASLTGHLVLSTIHTNSASATIQRLINMGVEPFLISSALKMVISQRLVKGICPHCKAETQANPNLVSKAKEALQDLFDEEELANLKFYKGTGCEHCNNTGYKGRIGVHELLVLGDYLEESILTKKSSSHIHELAKENGMITIMQDAIIKAIMGKTTLEEVFKLV